MRWTLPPPLLGKMDIVIGLELARERRPDYGRRDLAARLGLLRAPLGRELDVGFAEGANAAALRALGATELIGIDADEEFAAAARSTTSRRGSWDVTHLRFFTRTDAVALVERAGLEVVSVDHAEAETRKRRLAYALTRGRAAEFLTIQWYVLGVRGSAASP